MRRSLLLFAAVSAFATATLQTSSQPAAGKAYLLNVSNGQLPGDTGTEVTKLSLEDHDKLGGKALKVVLVNSFGERTTRVANWHAHSALAFNVYNPSNNPIQVGFNVRHRLTKNYDTRVDIPIALKPGLNEVRLKIAEMTNSNGSSADLANVVNWYVAIDGKPATLYFGDIWFEGGPSTAAGTSKAGSDPARLARIRAAKMPAIDKPIMFDTPEADAICSALEIFPDNNPWNVVVEDWPVHPNSKNIVASIGANKPFRYNPDMGFVLIPPGQKKVDVNIVGYPEESDLGPFPLPNNVPIEGWPGNYLNRPKLTLEDVQRDKIKEGGDRHAIVVDPTKGMLYEFYQLKKTNAGWQATQSSIFDLKSNKLRPDGWTSTDAAGLPLFPATIRYDELKRGIVEHAIRFTAVRTRRAYVYPATHFASKLTDINLPRMGERFRLKKDVDISGFMPEVQAILKGLKKYGMYMADNGLDWAISCAPDPRMPNMHQELRKLKGSDFEVVEAPAGYVPPR
jgi:hypothetical protein